MNFLLAALLTATPAADMESALAAVHAVTLDALAVPACAQPDGLQVAQTWADPSRLVPPKAPLVRFKARNAFGVLGTLCGKPGVDFLAKRLRDVRTLRDQFWKDLFLLPKPKNGQPDPKAQETLQAVNDLFVVEREALAVFREAKDPALVDDLVPRIQTDTVLQREMIAYFSTAARGHPAVKIELLKLRANTSSKPLIDAINVWLTLTP